MCDACYERDRRARAAALRPPPPERICECGRPVGKYGNSSTICPRCYDRNRRRARGIGPRHVILTCTRDDCDAPHVAKGLCSKHYYMERNRRLHKPRPKHSTKILPTVTRGIWTDDGETVTLCWPPKNAGPEWTCTCGTRRTDHLEAS